MLTAALGALAATASVLAQAPDGATGTVPERPDLGPAAAPPDGAPPGLATIDRNDLRRHAYWLADDARDGRFTASKGQRAAAAYVAEHFQRLGLAPLGDKRGFLQQYPLDELALAKGNGLVFGKHDMHDGFAVLHASDKDKVTLRGRFAWCGNGAADGLPALKGRIPVVLLSGADRGGVGGDLQAVQRYVAIAKNLEKAGAAAGVVCLTDDHGSLANTLNYRALLPDHSRLSLDGPERPLVAVPLLVLNGAHSRVLCEHLGVAIGDGAASATAADDKASGKLTIQLDKPRKTFGSNVVAVLEGTDRKSEAIVFSAHHDHVGTRLDGDRFNGADDNASGTAGLLEIAAAFATASQRPERSIVFLSVSGEELGLWGSQWYADHPTWPLAKIVADINIDMIGRAGRQDGKIAMQVTPSHQHEKYSTLVKDGVALADRFGIAFTSGDTYYARSDHYNFAKQGVPVVFFCDGEHPDYHQVTDTPDRLDYDAMEAIARLAYWTGWRAAQAKGRPTELGTQPSW